MDAGAPTDGLLNALRSAYHTLDNRIHSEIAAATDSTVVARLGDDVDEYLSMTKQYHAVFPQEELETVYANVAAMQIDIQRRYQEVLDSSHHGRPQLIRTVRTGSRGRPRKIIDRAFLEWAYSQRSTTGISRFLHVGRTTVRNALLEYGLAVPQADPFAYSDGSPQVSSYTGPLSTISDTELDALIRTYRVHYREAGLSILDGMLRNDNYRIPRQRVRDSLARVDPRQHIFDRIRINRRTYNVAGPNALWHHDGQHGLIRWRIVTHGFIDGYSRLITGLRASDNNRAETVLDVFSRAAYAYGVPYRMRGDHGVENLLVAACMENFRGVRRGSYIWGKSIHNIRIERLWVDITAQVGSTWRDHFTRLELEQGLDINNQNHCWLLHFLFLPTINTQLQFFAESWNQHRIQIRDGPNRSPADMFGFDMFVHGIRGERLLPGGDISEEGELSVEQLQSLEQYGVDWEALDEPRFVASHQENNQDDHSSSWVGRIGPPDNLNEVAVDSSPGPFNEEQVQVLEQAVAHLRGVSDDLLVSEQWRVALITARVMDAASF